MQAGLDQFPQPRCHRARYSLNWRPQMARESAAQVENPHGESRCQSVGGHDRDAEVANDLRPGPRPESRGRSGHPGYAPRIDSRRSDRRIIFSFPKPNWLGYRSSPSRLRGGSPGFTLNITLAMAEFASATAAIRIQVPRPTRPSTSERPHPSRGPARQRPLRRPGVKDRSGHEAGPTAAASSPSDETSTRQPARPAASATAGSGFAFIE